MCSCDHHLTQQDKISFYWDSTGSTDVEDIQRYTKGGFHPIRLGDVLSSHAIAPDSPPQQRYRILHKLGRGEFSTVWFAQALHERSQQYVALKICAANGDPEHERSIFNRLSEEQENVVKLRNTFSLEGPNGLHTVLVYDVLGNPLGFIHQAGGSKHIKLLCHQVTSGLAALHRHGIVHGDIHSGNVGIVLPTLTQHSPDDILKYFGRPQCDIIVPNMEPGALQALPPYLVHSISISDYLLEKDTHFIEGSLQAEILDLGNATIVGDPPRPASALPAICAPEIIFVAVVDPLEEWPPSTQASDVWSLACTFYKLAFGTELFDFAPPNFDYAAPSDSERDALLGAMVMLWGEVPLKWKSYWDSREQLRSISVSYETADAEWQRRLEHVTQVHGGIYSKGDIIEIFRLIRSILKFSPESRPTVEDVLRDPWFT